MTPATLAQPNEEIAKFLDLYDRDAVAFVRDVLGVQPDPWQVEALEAVSRGDRRIAIRSCHGPGKTALLAWVIIWHMTTKLPQKTVCTAASAPQLYDGLVPEVKMWLARLPEAWKDVFEPLAESISLKASPDESFVSFRTSKAETPEAMAGVHSDNVLLIADEASGIPEPVFEAASGSMSGENAMTILAGNPVRLSGLFYDCFHKLRDVWTTIHVSAFDSPRVTEDYILDMARRYGESSNPYRVRVLGEFPLAEHDSVIPFDLAELALNRDVAPQRVQPIWGLDPARMGRDRSALSKRRGNVLTEPVEAWSGLDTMELCGRVMEAWKSTPDKDKPSDICIDAIGLGAGVCDRLRELGLPARAINVSESSSMKERYYNLKAELWFSARDWFESRAVRIAGDDALMAELVAIEYKILSNGKHQIKSKDDMAAINGHDSPDLADSFVLTFAVPAMSASGFFAGSGRPAHARNILGLP